MRIVISIITFLLLLLPILCFSQPQGGSIKTSFVLQKWNIEKIDDPITEGTFPIEVIYPIRENINLQINHFPALSKFGKNNMSGLSDTWVRTTYSFAGDKALASVGIGIPTGKTELDSSEIILARLLGEQSFKFQLPVFGQGLTISGGLMYAYPFNDKFTIGGGLNYVFRNSYKFSTLNSVKYNPGEQFGINMGFDYLIIENLRSNIDFIFNYYTTDKMDNRDIFTSGPRFSTQIGLIYQLNNNYYWLQVVYQAKSKNEIYNTLDEKLESESKNSNITIRELHLGGKFKLTDKILLSVVGEARSYLENEYLHGWVDLAGGGVIGEYQLSETFSLFSGLKLFFGDGEFGGTSPALQGFELQVGSNWNF